MAHYDSILLVPASGSLQRAADVRDPHPVANRQASVAEPAVFVKNYGSNNDKAQNDCQGCNAMLLHLMGGRFCAYQRPYIR